ncbi:hypothetical protein EJ08DRAFT_646678 [Tothia fuscella]|uniref:Uncharacterized protein n=1 Tax=Tothia fuscella TaxID=1048955 RepID=A0A9P4NXJ4_9PEZI|nr:hypothetical protein EJ08DRAFT_646678 [Tothia fuscella]
MESSRHAPKPAAVSPPAAAPPPPAEPFTHVEETHVPVYPMDPLLDEFAQTRPPDDLFDDDFTPITESEAVHDPPPPTIQEQEQPQFLREPPKGPRGRGGRRDGDRGGASGGRNSPPRVALQAKPEGEVAAEEESVDSAATPKVERKEGAVRGDRSGTGGVKKAKLTETELADRIAAMSLKNAALLEAHTRSQRDQESFEANEAIAQQRRKEERANRQQMMGEREKNRQRKLQAVGGREWDTEKNEEDFRDTANDRKARRGAHGGIGGSRHASAASEQGEDLIPGFQIKGSAERGRGRGRGGRGRGRGGNDSSAPHTPRQQPQAPPSTSDFPDLPATTKKTEETKAHTPLTFPNKAKAAPKESGTPATAKTDAKPKLPHQASFGLSSPAGEKKSWADQVEGVTSPT